MKSMIRILTVSIFMVLGTSAFSQIDILAGAGFSFGTAAKTIGLHLRGDVDITDQWGGSLNIIPYFKSGAKYWEVNFDGHYTFYDVEPWTIYGLAGLNLSTVGVKGLSGLGLGVLGNVGLSSTKIGLNVGGGARYSLTPNISLVGEVKYIISSFDQLVITVAGLYHF